MKDRNLKAFILAICFILTFIIWTVLVYFIDVQEIGPRGSAIGIATINGYIHNVIGVHMTLYVIIDWLSLIPIGFCLAFAVVGLAQWIKRKHILKVDFSILALGIFYIIVFGIYVVFEFVVVNYRPVLIDGFLQASYPSSTTMLVLCIIPTALFQFNRFIKNNMLKKCVFTALITFTIFMVVGRFVSGVHWFSDIIGGILISAGLVTLYYSILSVKR